MKVDRREFVKNAAIFAIFGWIVSPFKSLGTAFAANFRQPAPAGKKIADPTKGQAKNMKYVHHTADYPATAPNSAKWKGKENCKGCNHFKPDAKGDAWGKCSMVANNYVYEDGMCQMWMKKA